MPCLCPIIVLSSSSEPGPLRIPMLTTTTNVSNGTGGSDGGAGDGGGGGGRSSYTKSPSTAFNYDVIANTDDGYFLRYTLYITTTAHNSCVSKVKAV
ncbi:hypothetical protein M0804_010826 [Polistes exclamans]|nr:hypothetical protein M0804_010826 [Polistes exclamans]